MPLDERIRRAWEEGDRKARASLALPPMTQEDRERLAKGIMESAVKVARRNGELPEEPTRGDLDGLVDKAHEAGERLKAQRAALGRHTSERLPRRGQSEELT